MVTGVTGIVISRHGKEVLIEDEQGSRHRCITRQQLAAVISGDRVRWLPQSQGHGSIVAILPRRSELTAQTRDGKRRIVAANIDCVVIVCATQPQLQLDLLDHYLVACESASIPAVIVFNKTDLLTPEQRTAIQTGLAPYSAIGYPVLYLSTRDGAGLENVQQLLAGKTAVLVGQSGVGKSSLLQALVPAATARVGELSDEQGRHTTSHSELYHLPSGGYVIDSPGVRSFNFEPLETRALAQAFIEFRPMLGQCRFADCTHQHEPGCAIKSAVASQQITTARYDSYLKMLTTMTHGQHN